MTAIGNTFAVKRTINKTQRLPAEWEKIYLIKG